MGTSASSGGATATPRAMKCRWDRGCGTGVKWLSGLILCMSARTYFVACPKVRLLLPTDSTSQIVPAGPKSPFSRGHTDAHALAPKQSTHEIKSHWSKAKIESKHVKSSAPTCSKKNVCNLSTSWNKTIWVTRGVIGHHPSANCWGSPQSPRSDFGVSADCLADSRSTDVVIGLCGCAIDMHCCMCVM